MNRTHWLILFLAVATVPLWASLPVQWMAAQAAGPAVASGGGSSPTPDGLWVKLNDGSGTTATAAFGPNLTVDVGWQTGYVDLNGTSTDMRTASTLDLSSSKVITVCFWFYANGTGDYMLAESSANYGGNYGTWFIAWETSVLRAGMREDDSRVEHVSQPSTGAWHHIAVVIDTSTSAGNVKFYKDGTLDTTETVDNNAKTASAGWDPYTVYFGARNTSSLFANGSMDDIRIYLRELNATEVSQVYGDRQ